MRRLLKESQRDGRYAEEWKKILKYLVVGSCSTGIDFVVYMLLSQTLPITVSKGVSMTVSSIFSYFANKKFTFSNREKSNVGYLLRFYTVFLCGFCTNLGANYIGYNLTGSKILAFVLATACGMIVNYTGQRIFVFK